MRSSTEDFTAFNRDPVQENNTAILQKVLDISKLCRSLVQPRNQGLPISRVTRQGVEPQKRHPPNERLTALWDMQLSNL